MAPVQCVHPAPHLEMARHVPHRTNPGRRPGCGGPCRVAGDDSPALARPLAVPRLPAHPSVARRHRRLRRAAGVLGCGVRNRLGDGVDQSVPRISVTDPGRAGGPYRRGAGLAHPVLRDDGPAAARRSRRAPAHPPGGPGGVPASGGGEPAGEGGDGHRRACISGRGDGGGLLDRRAAEQARVVRIVGVPGGVAGRSGGAPEESSAQSCAGADDLPAGRRRLPGGRGEPGVSRVACGGDSRRVERAGELGGDVRGAGAGGAGVGCARGGRGRTTTRCCVRSGGKGTSRDDREVRWKDGRRDERKVPPKDGWRHGRKVAPKDGGRHGRKVAPKDGGRPGLAWCAGCCARGACGCRTDSPPVCCPNAPRTPSSLRRSPAGARRTSSPGSRDLRLGPERDRSERMRRFSPDRVPALRRGSWSRLCRESHPRSGNLPPLSRKELRESSRTHVANSRHSRESGNDYSARRCPEGHNRHSREGGNPSAFADRACHSTGRIIRQRSGPHSREGGNPREPRRQGNFHASTHEDALLGARAFRPQVGRRPTMVQAGKPAPAWGKRGMPALPGQPAPQRGILSCDGVVNPPMRVCCASTHEGAPLGARASCPQRAGGPPLSMRAGRPRSQQNRSATGILSCDGVVNPPMRVWMGACLTLD